MLDNKVLIVLGVLFLLFVLFGQRKVVDSPPQVGGGQTGGGGEIVQQSGNSADGEFCPYGYCGEFDAEKYVEYLQHFAKNYPYCQNYAMQGYENPYIYPYNYFLNQNHPIGRFKHPGWVRQLGLELTNHKGFPGYGY